MDIPTRQNKTYKAYVLVGPTAVGKSDVAQWIAEEKGWSILSADSMLVYRGMTIGTAKPSMEERRRVRYWGVDLVEPSSVFNVAMFIDEARRCMESTAPDQSVIVVGGTGLYLRALIEGLSEAPAGSTAVRVKWEGVLAREGVEGLRRALRERNKEWFDSLADQRNPRRLIRALERHDAGGATPLRSWRCPADAPLVAGLSMARDDLHRRIQARVQRMYTGGLLNETRRILAAWSAWSPTASQAIGYKEAAACLGGTLSRDAAMELTVIRTRQLAKRQLTWFRRQMAVEWIDVKCPMRTEETAKRVLKVWDVIGATPLRI